MATIALIWELGADYGHISRFLPLARALKAAGHRPVMLLRDISRVESLFADEDIDYLQAPLWLPPQTGLPPDLNLTETLFRFGFLEPTGLAAIVRAWRTTLRLVRPDLLVLDHAPSALLATRDFGVPRMLIGNSFAVPRLATPMPPYRFWLDHRREAPRLAETEARLVRNANAALHGLGATPLAAVADLYRCEKTFILGHAPLDVYGERPGAHYLGPINNQTKGVTPAWPRAPGKRVFAYLKPQFAATEDMLAALAAAGSPTLVFAPGIAAATAKKFASHALVFSPSPYRMEDIRREADLGVCHAGGVVDVMLEAGRPVLTLPTQMEQIMFSRRIEALGVGLAQGPEDKPANLKKLLRRLLDEPAFTAAAAAYAATLPVHTNDARVAAIVGHCEALLRG